MNAPSLTASIPTQQHIKSMHLKQIFLSALRNGGISRAHLKQELHLSFPSVSALVDELLTHRILTESGPQQSSVRGRPRTLLCVNPHALTIPVLVMTREGYHYAVYDCAVTCLEKGFLPFSPNTQPVPDDSGHWCPSVETLCKPLEDWSRRIARSYRAADLLLVVPGSVNESNGLSSSALKMSSSNTFLPRLREITTWNVIVQNNSDCLAYAERIRRPLLEDFIYIYIGKGVGAGIIRSGKVFRNHGPRAGEIGHICIHYDGRPCSCGGKGCLESYVSTSAITQDAQNTAPEAAISSFDDVCTAYANGNREIARLLQEKARFLAIGIHNMLTMQPVSHVILGGKAHLLGPVFLSLIQDFLQTNCPRHQTSITFAQTSSESESFGAVWNYLEHLMNMDRLFSS